LLNNRLLGFTLEDNHPNVVAPGKRPVHTLNAFIAHGPDNRVVAGCTPGAHWQVQTNLHMLINVVDFKMGLPAANAAPRVLLGNGLDAVNERNPAVNVESRLAGPVVEELRGLGHPIRLIGPWAAAGAMQLIARDPIQGTFSGASEPRRDEAAVVGI
jgi:gamma-glutamyltranspeptidase/glutathione hydrolase